MPGIGLVMDGAMQQAPQPARQAAAGDELEYGREGAADGMRGLSVQVARLRGPA
jgi:hypothetical protein